jgi:hypothetical protein
MSVYLLWVKGYLFLGLRPKRNTGMLEYWNNGFVNNGLMDEWVNTFNRIKLK